MTYFDVLQGIKLEAFIFDPLPLSENLVLMEVDRSAHFAPVKNANGAKADTPATAKAAVLGLHKRWHALCHSCLLPSLQDSYSFCRICSCLYT